MYGKQLESFDREQIYLSYFFIIFRSQWSLAKVTPPATHPYPTEQALPLPWRAPLSMELP